MGEAADDRRVGGGNLGALTANREVLNVARLSRIAVVAAVLHGSAYAQEVRVGVNLPYTGVAAEIAQQMDRGMELYLKLNADKVKPYAIKLIKRDVKNPGGADAKDAVQELLTQHNVHIDAGWLYSPNAIATAPLVTACSKLSSDHERRHSAYHQPLALLCTSPSHVARRRCAERRCGRNTRRQDRTPSATAISRHGKDSRDAFKRAFEARQRHSDR